VYQLRKPHGDLAPWIEHYWFVTSDHGPVDIRVDVFVDGRADLIFNFGVPYVREVIGGAKTKHGRSNLDAQRLVPIRILQRGLVRIAGVRFRLGGLGPFTREPLAPFTSLTPAPSAVLGAGARKLDAALKATTDIDAQARLLDAFFLERLAIDDAYGGFGAALGRLVASDGNATIEETARVAAVSSRQVDRLFARYLGIAPKVVARILRFQRTIRGLMQDPSGSLAELAVSAGYFDQAHFIKDFKRLSGGVPRGYRGYYPPESPTDFAPNVVVFLQDAAPRRARASEPRTRST